MSSILIRGTKMDKSSFVNGIAACAFLPAESFKNGAHARFYDLGDGWGVKYFLFENQRDENYQKQKELAELELAPKIGVKFQFTRGTQQMFGYFTEVAIPYDVCCENVEYNHLVEDDYMGFYSVTRQMREKGDEAGVHLQDLHEGNVAWLPRLEEWVVIDFSTATDTSFEHHRWRDVD